jgi:hypothetical protein
LAPNRYFKTACGFPTFGLRKISTSRKAIGPLQNERLFWGKQSKEQGKTLESRLGPN